MLFSHFRNLEADPLVRPFIVAVFTGQGVTAFMLGTTTRTDGSIQVTYNGWPLYYFANNKAAGNTTGEGSQSVWYVITPDGMQKKNHTT